MKCRLEGENLAMFVLLSWLVTFLVGQERRREDLLLLALNRPAKKKKKIDLSFPNL